MAAVPYLFANVTTNQPGANLDANFAYVLAATPTPAVLQASENIGAGAMVNIWGSGATFQIRNANASLGLEAHGFVLSAVLSGSSGSVFRLGEVTNSDFTLTAGSVFLSTTPGGISNNPPTPAAGVILQVVGIADSPTSFLFTYNPSNAPV